MSDSSDPRAYISRLGQGDSVRNIELRLETMAVEMRELIDSGPRDEREALHAYAVSLLGEPLGGASLDGAEAELAAGAPSAPASSGTNAATLIGYGALLLPAGGFLALVLPPVGLMLALTAVVLIVSGLALAVVSRFRRLVA